MRLDFHILWIDDVPDLVAEKEPRLRRAFEDHGFNLKVTPAKSVAEATSQLGDEVFSDDIDLILVDYKLGGGPHGDVALLEIRRSLKYREMIFYSAESVKTLRDLAHAQGVEGVYCSNRETLTEVTEAVFVSIVRKVLDIDHCRGIVMGATSDVDALIIECIHILFDGADDAAKGAMISYALERSERHLKDMQYQVAAIRETKEIGEILKRHMIFTSEDRLQLLRKELKRIGNFGNDVTALQEYSEGPMKKRNTLAHKRIVIDGFLRRLVDRDGEEITADEMKELRKQLLVYRGSVDGLMTKLRPSG